MTRDLDYFHAAPSARQKAWEWHLLLFALPVLPTIALISAAFLDRPHCGCTIENAAKSQLSTLQAALEQYRIDTGRYPTTAEGLGPLTTAPPGLTTWHGPYLVRRPVDPWGRPFVYQSLSPTNPQGYDLLSRGRDGLLGSSDDILPPG